MRTTCIKITRKANLGNYESLEFTAEAVLDEGDNVHESTEKLIDYVDWHSQKPIRETKARNYRAVIATENATEAQKHEAEVWLKMYEERKLKVEGMQ